MIHDEDRSGAVFPRCAREFSGFPVFFRISRISRSAKVQNFPASFSSSELSAHQMARPGHLRTKAYRSIFSEACVRGLQFPSMSAPPIIQTHKSSPGSSDSLSLCPIFSQARGHRQDRECSTCVATQSTGEHHFSMRQESVLQFIAWSLARCEQLTEGQSPCTLAFTASQSYACREGAE